MVVVTLDVLFFLHFVFDPWNGNSIVEVVTLDVRGASLVNDESGIYRCGAQSTLVIDFKLKCEHAIKYKYKYKYQYKYKNTYTHIYKTFTNFPSVYWMSMH